ncbi:hypothetical protein GIB67_030794 [Kingdonia uniflora]|uniref:Uncharacterized protein n=1 Tax=Kingdonia uniflora TaxID=39325 RepID=A0A7J7L314_9MAGN|nr:hypothetical protein GIB67_030794 [Kingdonia uniflora]
MAEIETPAPDSEMKIEDRLSLPLEYAENFTNAEDSAALSGFKSSSGPVTGSNVDMLEGDSISKSSSISKLSSEEIFKCSEDFQDDETIFQVDKDTFKNETHLQKDEMLESRDLTRDSSGEMIVALVKQVSVCTKTIYPTKEEEGIAEEYHGEKKKEPSFPEDELEDKEENNKLNGDTNVRYDLSNLCATTSFQIQNSEMENLDTNNTTLDELPSRKLIQERSVENSMKDEIEEVKKEQIICDTAASSTDPEKTRVKEEPREKRSEEDQDLKPINLYEKIESTETSLDEHEDSNVERSEEIHETNGAAPDEVCTKTMITEHDIIVQEEEECTKTTILEHSTSTDETAASDSIQTCTTEYQKLQTSKKEVSTFQVPSTLSLGDIANGQKIEENGDKQNGSGKVKPNMKDNNQIYETNDASDSTATGVPSEEVSEGSKLAASGGENTQKQITEEDCTAVYLSSIASGIKNVKETVKPGGKMHQELDPTKTETYNDEQNIGKDVVKVLSTSFTGEEVEQYVHENEVNTRLNLTNQCENSVKQITDEGQVAIDLYTKSPVEKTKQDTQEEDNDEKHKEEAELFDLFPTKSNFDKKDLIEMTEQMTLKDGEDSLKIHVALMVTNTTEEEGSGKTADSEREVVLEKAEITSDNFETAEATSVTPVAEKTYLDEAEPEVKDPVNTFNFSSDEKTPVEDADQEREVILDKTEITAEKFETAVVIPVTLISEKTGIDESEPEVEEAVNAFTFSSEEPTTVRAEERGICVECQDVKGVSKEILTAEKTDVDADEAEQKIMYDMPVELPITKPESEDQRTRTHTESELISSNPILSDKSDEMQLEPFMLTSNELELKAIGRSKNAVDETSMENIENDKNIETPLVLKERDPMPIQEEEHEYLEEAIKMGSEDTGKESSSEELELQERERIDIMGIIEARGDGIPGNSSNEHISETEKPIRMNLVSGRIELEAAESTTNLENNTHEKEQKLEKNLMEENMGREEEQTCDVSEKGTRKEEVAQLTDQAHEEQNLRLIELSKNIEGEDNQDNIIEESGAVEDHDIVPVGGEKAGGNYQEDEEEQRNIAEMEGEDQNYETNEANDNADNTTTNEEVYEGSNTIHEGKGEEEQIIEESYIVKDLRTICSEDETVRESSEENKKDKEETVGKGLEISNADEYIEYQIVELDRVIGVTKIPHDDVNVAPQKLQICEGSNVLHVGMHTEEEIIEEDYAVKFIVSNEVETVRESSKKNKEEKEEPEGKEVEIATADDYIEERAIEEDGVVEEFREISHADETVAKQDVQVSKGPNILHGGKYIEEQKIEEGSVKDLPTISSEKEIIKESFNTSKEKKEPEGKELEMASDEYTEGQMIEKDGVVGEISEISLGNENVAKQEQQICEESYVLHARKEMEIHKVEAYAVKDHFVVSSEEETIGNSSEEKKEAEGKEIEITSADEYIEEQITQEDGVVGKIREITHENENVEKHELQMCDGLEVGGEIKNTEELIIEDAKVARNHPILSKREEAGKLSLPAEENDASKSEEEVFVELHNPDASRCAEQSIIEKDGTDISHCRESVGNEIVKDSPEEVEKHECTPKEEVYERLQEFSDKEAAEKGTIEAIAGTELYTVSIREDNVEASPQRNEIMEDVPSTNISAILYTEQPIREIIHEEEKEAEEHNGEVQHSDLAYTEQNLEDKFFYKKTELNTLKEGHLQITQCSETEAQREELQKNEGCKYLVDVSNSVSKISTENIKEVRAATNLQEIKDDCDKTLEITSISCEDKNSKMDDTTESSINEDKDDVKPSRKIEETGRNILDTPVTNPEDIFEDDRKSDETITSCEKDAEADKITKNIETEELAQPKQIINELPVIHLLVKELLLGGGKCEKDSSSEETFAGASEYVPEAQTHEVISVMTMDEIEETRSTSRESLPENNGDITVEGEEYQSETAIKANETTVKDLSTICTEEDTVRESSNKNNKEAERPEGEGHEIVSADVCIQENGVVREIRERSREVENTGKPGEEMYEGLKVSGASKHDKEENIQDSNTVKNHLMIISRQETVKQSSQEDGKETKKPKDEIPVELNDRGVIEFIASSVRENDGYKINSAGEDTGIQIMEDKCGTDISIASSKGISFEDEKDGNNHTGEVIHTDVTSIEQHFEAATHGDKKKLELLAKDYECDVCHESEVQGEELQRYEACEKLVYVPTLVYEDSEEGNKEKIMETNSQEIKDKTSSLITQLSSNEKNNKDWESLIRQDMDGGDVEPSSKSEEMGKHVLEKPVMHPEQIYEEVIQTCELHDTPNTENPKEESAVTVGLSKNIEAAELEKSEEFADELPVTHLFTTKNLSQEIGGKLEDYCLNSKTLEEGFQTVSEAQISEAQYERKLDENMKERSTVDNTNVLIGDVTIGEELEENVEDNNLKAKENRSEEPRVLVHTSASKNTETQILRVKDVKDQNELSAGQIRVEESREEDQKKREELKKDSTKFDLKDVIGESEAVEAQIEKTNEEKNAIQNEILNEEVPKGVDNICASEIIGKQIAGDEKHVKDPYFVPVGAETVQESREEEEIKEEEVEEVSKELELQELSLELESEEDHGVRIRNTLSEHVPLELDTNTEEASNNMTKKRTQGIISTNAEKIGSENIDTSTPESLIGAEKLKNISSELSFSPVGDIEGLQSKDDVTIGNSQVSSLVHSSQEQTLEKVCKIIEDEESKEVVFAKQAKVEELLPTEERTETINDVEIPTAMAPEEDILKKESDKLTEANIHESTCKYKKEEIQIQIQELTPQNSEKAEKASSATKEEEISREVDPIEIIVTKISSGNLCKFEVEQEKQSETRKITSEVKGEECEGGTAMQDAVENKEKPFILVEEEQTDTDTKEEGGDEEESVALSLKKNIETAELEKSAELTDELPVTRLLMMKILLGERSITCEDDCLDSETLEGGFQSASEAEISEAYCIRKSYEKMEERGSMDNATVFIGDVTVGKEQENAGDNHLKAEENRSEITREANETKEIDTETDEVTEVLACASASNNTENQILKVGEDVKNQYQVSIGENIVEETREEDQIKREEVDKNSKKLDSKNVIDESEAEEAQIEKRDEDREAINNEIPNGEVSKGVEDVSVNEITRKQIQAGDERPVDESYLVPIGEETFQENHQEEKIEGEDVEEASKVLNFQKPTPELDSEEDHGVKTRNAQSKEGNLEVDRNIEDASDSLSQKPTHEIFTTNSDKIGSESEDTSIPECLVEAEKLNNIISELAFSPIEDIEVLQTKEEVSTGNSEVSALVQASQEQILEKEYKITEDEERQELELAKQAKLEVILPTVEIIETINDVESLTEMALEEDIIKKEAEKLNEDIIHESICKHKDEKLQIQKPELTTQIIENADKVSIATTKDKTPREVDPIESTLTKISGEKLDKSEVEEHKQRATQKIASEVKVEECGGGTMQDAGDGTHNEPIPSESDKISLSDLLQGSTGATVKITEDPTEESNSQVGNEEVENKEKTCFQVEEEKTDKVKKEGGDEEEEHLKIDSSSFDAPVIVEASRDIDVTPVHKKSHNILSGVGSKVKHSIAKMKKAITGKSSHHKPSSPK